MVDRALDALGSAASVAPPRGAGVQARVPRRRVRAEERAALRRSATAATGSRSSCAPTSPSTSAAARRADAGRGRGRDAGRARGAAVQRRSRARGQRVGLPRSRLPQAVRAPLHRGLRAEHARLATFPVFSGKYSTFSYLDETVHAVEDMLRRLDVSAGTYYDSVRSAVLPPAVPPDAGAGDVVPLRARSRARRSSTRGARRAVRRGGRFGRTT